ncbi:hypothetical protein BHU72_05395 [Desulfuribacillus stibiiarsenatis]|uniref:ABC3 transporter permease C-terminal domain-containing protein n=1 Tax=Desulfuribacillus stibiiarsenatis TaxID=1390249 RepID=A0A1E5L4L9_9FIRM|nr:ABC transporter permease [Desulfuribacillus stibiiarsenatis]OEH85046.1 hypothetical protein BHU72_05395 [Desulfuribacillus stibiiarsenatis]
MFHLAWRNVTRRMHQSLLTILLVAIAIATFVIAHMILAMLQGSIQLSSERLGADVVVLPQVVGVNAQQTLFTAEPVNAYMPSQYFDRILEIEGIAKATPQFFTQSLDESCCNLKEAKRLIGYDASTDFLIAPWLETEISIPLDPEQILIGGIVKPFFGDHAIILDEIFVVAGQLKQTGTGMDETIFMDIAVARELAAESPGLQGYWLSQNPEDLISVIMIQADEGYPPQLIARQINQMGLPVQAITSGEIIGEMKGQMQAVNQILLWLWIILAITSALALFGRFLSLARERRREIGVMRALGGRRLDAFLMVMIEVMFTVLVGWCIGILVGSYGSVHVMQWLKGILVMPPWNITPTDVFLTGSVSLGVAILLGLFAAFYPAWSSSRLDPQEAISRSNL